MEIKHVEDYYDKIKERYPDLEMWEIEKILKHGFQSLFTLNNLGADVLIKDRRSILIYFGKLFNNKEMWWKYRMIKFKIKYRINYFHSKVQWDGNYYFSLSEEDYNKLIPNKKGRYKKKITFPKLYAYKIIDEAKLPYNNKYLFKLTGEEDRGISFKEENYTTRNIELIAMRNKQWKWEDTNG